MKISSEFSNHAQEYGSYNIIQNRVIEKLLSDLKNKPKKILDLGCGSGSLCRAVEWHYEQFVGIDFASGMLELHPKSKSIEAIYGDFNDSSLFESLKRYEFDQVFSASALQWAENIEEVFLNLKELKVPLSLAIFTSGTFKTLNKTASLKSLLKDKIELEKIQKDCFTAHFEIINYTLEFESVREMFRYIKRTGVSGSRNVLSYKETKELMKKYPLNYLEFEVAFIRTH